MARGNGSMRLLTSFNFVDKDPGVDEARTIWQQEHLKETDLAALAGLSPSTVHNMFGGKTRRPQHLTYLKIYTALGYEYKLTRATSPDYDKAIPKAKAAYKEHKEELRKKREREAKREARR